MINTIKVINDTNRIDIAKESEIELHNILFGLLELKRNRMETEELETVECLIAWLPFITEIHIEYYKLIVRINDKTIVLHQYDLTEVFFLSICDKNEI